MISIWMVKLYQAYRT